jgi:glycosyltransferase involved in cell wall biosynthesis
MPGQTTIAVDLTPVLPGGENGGAKVFALELVRLLATGHPEADFVLLTQQASHDELSLLDAPNVRRVLAVGAGASALRPRLMGAAVSVLRYLPARARIAASSLAYRLHAMLKRGGAGGMLKELGADLLFCPFTAPTFHEAGVPTVCTVYDLQYLAYPQFFTVEDVVQRDRAFLDASRKATALAAISDYTRAAAMRHGALSPERISTIALRLARPPGAGDADGTVLRTLGVEPGRFLIYPANFWRHKNHEMLLAAFGRVLPRIDPAVKLVLTGAGAARQEWIARSARDMGLGARVVCAGFLPLEDLVLLMAKSSGVVFPSLYEGFGLPVVEAMALGVPVACSNTTALPEVAGDAALLFDPRIPEQVADSIVSLLQDGALRSRLVESGAQRAREFLDAGRMRDEYWSLFTSVMAR